MMLRLALTHIESQPIAEEIVQEAWLTVVRSLDRYERHSSTCPAASGTLARPRRARAVLPPLRVGDDGGHVTNDVLPEMPCRELVELITDYLEDRLSPVDRRRFEAHLATCDACRTYMEQFRQTIRVLGRLPEESLSSEARNALLAAFRDWSRR
jgi:anti-sigma factor RsiW